MSDYDVRVAHQAGIPLAVVRRVAKAAELSTLVPALCGEVWAFVRARNLQAGRNVAVYWNGDIRLEVGVELDGPLPEDAVVVRSATPAGPAASVTHFGPYQQLGAAHEAIRRWCAANGRRLAGPNWEIYGHWQNEWNTSPAAIRTDVYYGIAPS